MVTVTPKNRLIVDGVNWRAGFQVGFVPAGQSARQVFEGPMIPGPWAYAFGIPAVIDNHGGTKGEIERETGNGLVVRAKLGDVILVDGNQYRIEPDHNDNIKLVPVTT